MATAQRDQRGTPERSEGLVRFREKGGKVIVKPLPDELRAIYLEAEEAGIWLSSRDYVIPNRRPARGKERSPKVVYSIVKRIAARARVDAHPHSLRAAFAVQFDEQKPQHVIALKELLGHARLETTMVYLRRKDKAKAMEVVRDLSWAALRPFAGMPPAGFEPAFREQTVSERSDAKRAFVVPEPLRRKLDELRARDGLRCTSEPLGRPGPPAEARWESNPRKQSD